jgi:hypothetical protein
LLLLGVTWGRPETTLGSARRSTGRPCGCERCPSDEHKFGMRSLASLLRISFHKCEAPVSRTHFSEDLSQHLFFEQMRGPQTHTMLRNHHEYSTKRKAPISTNWPAWKSRAPLWKTFGSLLGRVGRCKGAQTLLFWGSSFY